MIPFGVVLFPPGDDWRKDGACAGMSFAKWFKENHSHAELDELKTLCNSCPVKKQCLEHALEYEEFGVWAGSTQEQRERYRKRKNFKPRP
jgi:WhiB family transcriptional regulator, redox-sensing transcriptional regulator